MDIKYTLSKLSAAVTTTNWQFVQTNRLQYIGHVDTGEHRRISSISFVCQLDYISDLTTAYVWLAWYKENFFIKK